MKNQITITEEASKQILSLINKENSSNLYFRIKVDGGGCAGFQYNFTFTDKKDNKALEVITYCDAPPGWRGWPEASPRSAPQPSGYRASDSWSRPPRPAV